MDISRRIDRAESMDLRTVKFIGYTEEFKQNLEKSDIAGMKTLILSENFKEHLDSKGATCRHASVSEKKSQKDPK